MSANAAPRREGALKWTRTRRLVGAAIVGVGDAIAIALGPGAHPREHPRENIPTILAGSAGGFLAQGAYVGASAGAPVVNHGGLLNTLGSAAGLRTSEGELIRDLAIPPSTARRWPSCWREC